MGNIRPINDVVPSAFHFGSDEVRVLHSDGDIWFVAVDVCNALKIGWDQSANRYKPGSVTKSLRDDEKAKGKVFSPSAGRSQSVTLISESGLYKMIMRGNYNNPALAKFQDWVTRDVLPAIRKDGAYIKDEEKVTTGELDEDAFVLKAMSILQGKVERLKMERDALAADNTSFKQVGVVVATIDS